MRPSFSRVDSELPFLEPPHSHDLTSVSFIATLPPSMMAQLPTQVQDSLWDLQESASVAYASYCRLQDLLDERFERLVPSLASDTPSFSESAFFTYSNHVKAEQNYLISDAFPDWRHKASITATILKPYGDLPLLSSRPYAPRTIDEWQSSLHTTVTSWLAEARSITVPDFEETMQEYLAGRNTMAVSDSEESTPLETPSYEVNSQPLRTLHASDFELDNHKIDCRTKAVPAKRVDFRKDSGICMDDDEDY